MEACARHLGKDFSFLVNLIFSLSFSVLTTCLDAVAGPDSVRVRECEEREREREHEMNE